MSPRLLSPRLRKFIGMIVILVFLVVYITVVASLADELPDHWAVKLAYYGFFGTLWGVPLFPLIRWMNREG
ncbi:DUF2842 domain-containing protein [Phenylobacterium sp.]|uniref:DUF2842 domain-containing protein n=1 Tax=Phenylobacterium sp. TaxID=1871053 RepID=UPI00301C7255